MTHDVFISHSSVNKAIADATCAILEQRGIRCWIAPRDVLPGNSYPAEIIRGIGGSQIVLLLFTSSSNTSPAVHRELERAFNHGKLILPFRLEDISPSQDVEFLIAGQHWLDAIQPPLNERIHELAFVLQRHLESNANRTSSSDFLSLKTSKIPKRVLPFQYWSLFLVLLLIVGLGVWGYLARSSQSNLVHLIQPDDYQVLVGNTDESEITLSFKLPPGHLNEEANVQIWPEGKSLISMPSRSAASYRLPDTYEGIIRWRVRAAWRDNPAVNASYGPWSTWRTFEYYRNRLSKILRTSKCVIGTGGLSPDGKLVNLNHGRIGGYEVDLLQAFFDREVAREHLPKPVLISYFSGGSWGNTYFHMLEKNPSVDMMVSGLTKSLEREQQWNVRFTEPTSKFYQVLLVSRATTPVKDGKIVLKKIGVANQTTNQDFLSKMFSRDPGRIYVSIGGSNGIFYDDLADQLHNGTIDGILIDEPDIPNLEANHLDVAQEWKAVELDPKQTKDFEYSSVSYALRPDDNELRLSLDVFISANWKLEEEIWRKYFPGKTFIR